jgi:hypothetical protein
MLLNICSRYERMRCPRIKQHNCREVVDGKRTDDYVRSFLGFLNCDMIDLSANIVLPSSNRNRICPRVGAGVDAAVEGGRLRGLGHWLAK